MNQQTTSQDNDLEDEPIVPVGPPRPQMPQVTLREANVLANDIRRIVAKLREGKKEA